MKTKKVSLYYKVTSREIIPPGQGEIDRKDYWVKTVQSTVEADWKPKTIKVTYEEYDPDVNDQRKFLNGPVLEYWIIQSQELHDKKVDSHTKKLGRETLFDKALGYDVDILGGGTRRKRRSTADFTTTQQMHNFLETLRETEFEPNGYEFPDSAYFWELEGAYGYEKAKEIAIEKLQEKLRARLG
jgi:hypothetical protein